MTTAIPDLDDGSWLDATDVMGVLAHRYPFLFVDRIRVVQPGRSALGLKRVTCGEHIGELVESNRDDVARATGGPRKRKRKS